MTEQFAHELKLSDLSDNTVVSYCKAVERFGTAANCRRLFPVWHRHALKIAMWCEKPTDMKAIASDIPCPMAIVCVTYGRLFLPIDVGSSDLCVPNLQTVSGKSRQVFIVR